MPGLQTQKRDLVVVDSTKFSVRLTLWGKQAEQFGAPVDSVIAFKGVRVGDFSGK
jgi:replication factor A1